jgi:hypothetical protein
MVLVYEKSSRDHDDSHATGAGAVVRRCPSRSDGQPAAERLWRPGTGRSGDPWLRAAQRALERRRRRLGGCGRLADGQRERGGPGRPCKRSAQPRLRSPLLPGHRKRGSCHRRDGKGVRQRRSGAWGHGVPGGRRRLADAGALRRGSSIRTPCAGSARSDGCAHQAAGAPTPPGGQPAEGIRRRTWVVIVKQWTRKPAAHGSHANHPADIHRTLRSSVAHNPRWGRAEAGVVRGNARRVGEISRCARSGRGLASSV